MMEERIQEAIEELTEFGRTELCEELIREYGVKNPDFARAALEANIFHPNILYQDASPEIRDKLISMLNQDEVENANGYLLALAAIGDDKVVENFQKWEDSSKPWREKLFVGPLKYAMEGGWCIEDGKRKQLFFDTCYALEKVEKCLPGENVFGGISSDKCSSCGSSYVNNLIIDGRDKRLAFLGLGGQIKIKYCVCCVYEFNYNYCKFEENGESMFILREMNGKPWEAKGEPNGTQTVSDDGLNNHECFVLSPKPVPQNYCDEFDRSAIGGRPAFVDDANYAVCPKCGKIMKHLAQLGEEYTKGGTEYIQVCMECQTAAVIYQQT